MNWDKYFMSMVYLTAMKSKDQSTNIGAIIVGPDNEIRSTGYNSFPRGIKDNVPERQQRPEKYYWFAHAERNSIYNAARMGTSLNGCRIYTNGIPCTDCAISIIQSGIREVIVDKHWDKNNSEKWSDAAKRTLIMFEEAGVKYRRYDDDIITNITALQNGKEFFLD